MTGITYAIIACYIDKGMKSKGSKCLMEFNKKKLLDYQIGNIISGHNKKIPYEIIIITNFETQKIQKHFSEKAKIIEHKELVNPIVQISEEAKYKNIFFIDYGCVYSKDIINNLKFADSFILSIKNKASNELDVGITKDNTDIITHMFFGLEDCKFTNMFYLSESDTTRILKNISIHRNNLLYFEIINFLVNQGSLIATRPINKNLFIFFNNARQKNGITKFIKNN
jgi:choline kinase